MFEIYLVIHFPPLHAIDHHTAPQISFSCQEVSNAVFKDSSHLPIKLTRIPFLEGPQSTMFSAPVLSAALVFSLASRVIAHEHHDDDIPEGEAISADPIVIIPPPPPPKKKIDVMVFSNNSPGYYSMGSHRNSNSFLRLNLPHRHGSWGIFSLSGPIL